jgi:hypothetical protein
MSDFSAFGGWTQPWGKQFRETATVCGMGADINVMNAAWTPAPNSPLVLKNGAPTAAAAAGAASITRDQLLKCMKGLSTAKADAVLKYMNAAMAEAQINTCRRKSAFIAQLGMCALTHTHRFSSPASDVCALCCVVCCHAVCVSAQATSPALSITWKRSLRALRMRAAAIWATPNAAMASASKAVDRVRRSPFACTWQQPLLVLAVVSVTHVPRFFWFVPCL